MTIFSYYMSFIYPIPQIDRYWSMIVLNIIPKNTLTRSGQRRIPTRVRGDFSISGLPLVLYLFIFFLFLYNPS